MHPYVRQMYSVCMALYAGIALLSGATLILELALLRVFALQQFYHFAFLAVSLALLGAGASGSFLTVRPRQWSRPALAASFGVSAAAAYLVINTIPFDSYAIAWDERQILYLSAYFLAAAVPFFSSGLLIGSELARAGSTGSSHRVYGANLIGSAAGSLASLPVLAAWQAPGAVLFAICLAALAGGLLLVVDWSGLQHRQAQVAVHVLLLVLAALAMSDPPAFWDIRLSPYKTLSMVKEAQGTRHILTRSDAASRVDVVASDAIHVMPGLSLRSPIGAPPQAGLLVDGENLMPVTALSPGEPEAAILAEHMPLGAAFVLRPGARALVLEAGTGLDVLLALAAGAESVTLTEENPLIAPLMMGPLAEQSRGLFLDEKVTVVTESARVFARTAGDQAYGVVILALTDSHRPVTSGAFSLTEDYLLTVEAIDAYMDLLDEDGLFMATRWLQTPPSESARAFATIAEALRERGEDAVASLVAFRSLRTMSVLASLRPFTQAEISRLQAWLDVVGFDAVYYAGIPDAALNRYNALPEPTYEKLFAEIVTRPDATLAAYPYDIAPATDDHPFFHHYFRWRQTPDIVAGIGLTWQPFGGSGYLVLVALLGLLTLAAFAFILAPLRWLGGRQPGSLPPSGRWRLRVFLYFAGLGLGFLFVEMPLAQHFILVLGEPVRALAAMVAAILLFSGMGAMTAPRWRLKPALGALVLTVALTPLALPPLTNAMLGLPSTVRLAAAIGIVAPLGFLMGLPFALGLAVIERQPGALVPWAWAINGSVSVISAVLSVMLALTFSLRAVLWLGAICYACAWLAMTGRNNALVKDPA